MEPVDSTAASALASAPIPAALAAALRRKGLLADDETRAVGEQARLFDKARCDADAGLTHVIDMARRMAEVQP
jgi:hypothetical protein